MCGEHGEILLASDDDWLAQSGLSLPISTLLTSAN